MASKTFEEFQLELGHPGRFRIILFFLCACNIFPVGFNTAFSIFTAFVPNHKCKVPINWTLNQTNLTSTIQSATVTFPDQCHLNGSYFEETHEVIPCPEGWEYDIREDEQFVSTEWNLVCDRRQLLSFGLSAHYFGILLGNILFSFLSDFFGRKKVMMISLTILSATSFGLSFVRTASLFFTFTFFIGVFMQGMHTTSYTMSSELFHPRHRTLQGIFIGIPWSLSLTIVAVLFWQLKNWRYVQLFISLQSTACLLYVWFIPESLRWYVAKGDIDNAMKVVKKFAHYNNTTLKSDTKEDLQSIYLKMNGSEQKSSKVSVFDLIRSPDLRRYTLILGCAYFATAASYMGVAFSLPGLGGNKYVSYGVSGLLDIISRCVSAYIFQRLGRRKPLSSFFLVSGCLYLIAPFCRFASNGSSEVFATLAITLALLGNLILVMTFSGMVLYVTEVFPTLMRTMGIGFLSVTGRLGMMATTQIIILEQYWSFLPMVLYGLMVIVAGLSILLLPETNKKPLPDTVVDIQNLKN